MIENNKLIFGVSFIIFGIVLLYYNFNNKDYNNDRPWDFAMLFKGLIGGLAAIAIGIVLLFRHFET